MKRWALLACAWLASCDPLGTRPPPAAAKPVRAIPTELDGSRWLRDEIDALRQVGAGPAEIVAVDAGAAGDSVAGMLAVPENTCSVVIARATETVEDLDLFVYGDDGTSYGSDEASDALPVLLVCPKQARRLYVAARIAQGHGIVAIGAQAVAPTEVQKVLRALGDKGQQTSEVWPGLEQRLAEHRALIGGAWEDVRRVPLPVDARVPTALSAELGPHSCLDVLALPSEEVSHLELLVRDEAGRIVGRAAAVGNERSVLLCSEHPARVSFEIRPHAGRGVAILVLSKSIPGTHLDVDADALRYDLTPAPDAGTKRRVQQRLEDLGYPRASKLLHTKLRSGRRSLHNVELPHGCSRLDVFAKYPMHGVDAWLWGPQGQLIAKARGGATTTLFACSKGETARLDLEATVEPGEVDVELRREQETPQPLIAEPLAASRLLARMIGGGVIATGAQVGAVRHLSLAPEQIQRMPILVPMGRCVDVTIGLGAGALGVELRLIDEHDNTEVTFARGPTSAGVRACALAKRGSLNALAEFRVVGGGASALVATRMLLPRP